MTTQQGIACPKCHHQNSPDAKFCNQCGARLKAPQPQPSPAPALAAAGRASTRDVFARLPHSKSHRSAAFYTAVFGIMSIITIIELGIFYVDVRAFKIPALMLLSSVNAALVAMFFMHLKGDRRLYTMLFVIPLFMGAATLVAVVGLFRNF